MTQLINSISVEGLVAQRDAILHAYDQVVLANENLVKMVISANDRFPMVDPQGDAIKVFKSPSIQVTGYRHGRSNDVAVGSKETRTQVEKVIDAGAWQTLISASGIRSFMSSAVRSKWADQISNLDVPPLTAENIRETMRDLHANRLSMMEEGVLAVFRALSTGYRTNQPQMFGNKILVSFMFTSYGGVNYDKANQLDDLVRVLSLQDGKPEPDHRQGISRLIGDAKPRNDKQQFAVEHEYFSLKCFPQSGTCHLKFKRVDLIMNLNRILAKHFPDALPSDLRDSKPSKAKIFSVEDIGVTPVSHDVLNALKTATIQANACGFILKIGVLDRSTYQAANEVLSTIGGTWMRSEKGHLFRNDPTDDLNVIVDQAGFLNPKSYGYFPTPDAVLEIMMDEAEVFPGMAMMEPSAGQGAIASRVMAFMRVCDMTLVEYLPRHAKHLRQTFPNVIEGDFLKVKATGTFDRVLMNPPFSHEQDIAHVRHAYDFLAPGGRLVAILASGWTTNQSVKAAAFREFLKPLQSHLTVLPKGSFEESGTSINTVMLVINRPLALS